MRTARSQTTQTLQPRDTVKAVEISTRLQRQPTDGAYTPRQASLAHVIRSWLSKEHPEMAKPEMDCLTDFTTRFIRSKVRRLIGRAGFTESDREDLNQDFSLDLIQRSKNFDPAAGNWHAFVVVVCENCFATILAHSKAERRSHQREAGSLNESTTDVDGKPVEFGATIPESQHARRTGQFNRSSEDACSLVLDMAGMLQKLPPRLREVCERMKHDSIAEVARQMGVSRTEIHRRLVRIRQRFEHSEMRDYL